ncbi:MAG: tRNA (adenosine(37)-N6)-threonylcarbamoyltransferase complex dimerization subunit type 1 TsaB [Candidatus Omnitrophica bacterium]|nr:tRNA (adenosine(37)-N6)-threonylcarbamoyltransferase complex dimerization subunit type 1 TsaB [Candidatus Omnitrophota bacterium]
MNLLAIETSSPTLSVAIKKTGGKLRHATVQGYMKHAENLLPVIDRLLKKEKLKIGDIDVFLISRGPGSFTGLRIGFATLKGFLATCPKPCYGASSLDVIAAGITPLQRPGLCKTETRSLQGGATLSLKGYENLTVCLDARRGKLYTRFYRYHKNKWSPNGPSRVMLIDEVKSALSDGCFIGGDGIFKFDTAGFTVAPEKNWVPQAATLIALFETKDPLLKKLRRPKEFLPVYLRRSEAEERLKDKKHA